MFRYNQWSPPAQSNETSNGYFLERSHSARLTLDKSIELCPEEEVEGEDAAVANTSGGGNNANLGGAEDQNSDTVAPPPALVGDDATAAVKPQALTRAVLGVSQPRPGHAQATSPRATAPPSNPNLSIPRSSSSQFPPLHPNRPQQPPVKNEGSNQSGPSPNH